MIFIVSVELIVKQSYDVSVKQSNDIWFLRYGAPRT